MNLFLMYSKNFLLFYPTISLIICLVFFLLNRRLSPERSFVVSYADLFYFWFYRPFFVYLMAGGLYALLLYLDIGRLPLGVPLNALSQIVFLYLAYDLLIYVAHVIFHNVSILYWIHSTHHSIEKLSWENGRKDSLMYELTVLAPFVYFFYVGQFSLVPLFWALLIWNFLVALSHFSERVSMGFLENILVLPQRHRHHHQDYKEVEWNFGPTIRLWDVLLEKCVKRHS